MSVTEQDPIYRITERAAEIIKDPEHWIKGNYARTEPDYDDGGMRLMRGHTTDYTSKEACCFCLEGALRRAAYELALRDYIPEVIAFGDRVVRDNTSPGAARCMIIYNDEFGRDHKEVLAMLATIKDARAKELEDDVDD